MAVAAGPVSLEIQAFTLSLLSCYLAYSLAMLALVWAPIRFAPSWSVAVHLFDFGVLLLLITTTRASPSPVFVCFLFLLVCASLRWHPRGILWTAAATLAGYGGISFYAANVASIQGFDRNTFLIRTVYLTIVTGLLTTLSAHRHRFQREIGQTAAWPRQVSRDPRAVVSEMLSQVSALMDVPSLLLVWDEGADSDFTMA